MRNFFGQLVDGLTYLHARGIAHRDIKLENIFVTHDFKLKIGDFGFATTKKKDWKFSGTESYGSPEKSRTLEYDTFQDDLWGLGVVLYILRFGFQPFAVPKFEDDHYWMLQTWKRKEYWTYVEHYSNQKNTSESLQEMLELMLSDDRALWLSLPQIKSHDWVVSTKPVSFDEGI